MIDVTTSKFRASIRTFVVAALLLSAFPVEAVAQRQMEALGRGVVAVRQTDGRVWVGWRLLGTDPNADWRNPEGTLATFRGESGRGLCLDIDPRHSGFECWVRGADIFGLFDARGELISKTTPRSCNFGVYWDGDTLSELLDRDYVAKWNWKDSTETVLLTAEGCTWNNGSKATPALSADILGDWREEVVWRTVDNKELRVYTTTVPTAERFYTFMHDPQYRLSVAWQNVAYNQPPHTSFFVGEGMKRPPRPNIVAVRVKK